MHAKILQKLILPIAYYVLTAVINCIRQRTDIRNAIKNVGTVNVM
jgi:hypothetical protein